MDFKILVTARVLSLSLLAAACVPVSGDSPTPVDRAFIPETGSTETETSLEIPTLETGTAAHVPTETQAVTETPTLAIGSQIMLMVNRSGATPFLVDQQGRSLYAYMNDTRNDSTSVCMDDCAVEWPPVAVLGTPVAGEGVNPILIKTIVRDDGVHQAVYNGWPLYYYNMDTFPGTTNGQSYNGVWFLISPSGDPIQR